MDAALIGKSSVARYRAGLPTVLFLAALIGNPGTVSAGQKNTAFAVTVTVLAVARLEIMEQAQVLTITAADIDQGYVDVADATSLAVKSNNPSGFMLNVYALTGIFKAIRVRWAGHEVELGAEGGAVAQRNAAPGRTAMQLSYRFVLGGKLQPGDYPWPLMLSARPL